MTDVKAAGDMVARFTDIGTQPRKNDSATAASRNTPAAAQNSATAASTANAPQQTDAVSLTETASAVRQAERALADEPAVDAARVEQLRAAVTDGSFQIDAQRVADKMINLESALSGQLG